MLIGAPGHRLRKKKEENFNLKIQLFKLLKS